MAIPSSWLGKTVAEADVRRKYHINIMAIKRDGQLDMSVTPDTLLTADKTLLVLGSNRDIQRCFHI